MSEWADQAVTEYGRNQVHEQVRTNELLHRIWLSLRFVLAVLLLAVSILAVWAVMWLYGEQQEPRTHGGLMRKNEIRAIERERDPEIYDAQLWFHFPARDADADRDAPKKSPLAASLLEHNAGRKIRGGRS